MSRHWLQTALLGLCVAFSANAQQAPIPADQEATYIPVYSDKMIKEASPEQAAIWRKVEADNRRRFNERQLKLQDRKLEAEEESRARQDAAEQKAAAERARREAAAAPKPTIRRSKVYKWVDANGRVHFGDAPQGRNAKEIKVGGAARIKGTPLPPPGSKRTDEEGSGEGDEKDSED